MNAQNHNPSGKNQHGIVAKACDPTLAAALWEYNRKLITDPAVIRELLKKEHGITMSARTVKRRRQELGIYGSGHTTKTMSHEQKTQLVLDAIQKDPNQRNGTRDFVANTMRMYDPSGFENREPTAKKIKRFPIVSLGPNAEWSDVASGKYLGLWVLPDNRLGEAVGYLYLSLVEELGGVPLQSTTDCGSETTVQYGYAQAIRSEATTEGDLLPELGTDELPAHRLDSGDNWVLVFKQGADTGIYDESNPKHYTLCRWLWSTFLQQELDEYRHRVNAAKTHKVKGKLLPSGVAPDIVYSIPERYGMKDRLLPIDVDVIREIKAYMGGDSIIGFVPPEYAQQARAAFDSLGVIKLSVGNVWSVFVAMLPIMYQP
ncbi:hypothetical protein BS47DRAFT_1363611 [Hydnum rufescens UP504]|uniref:Uncharacterized protein n=1 Tax=Hydnum rufescens UP504 TaxID=1448309 RepID=A0A9P6DVJ1_9AGAM|nr:hypothetical protein BS47DRAFT_1363611 [Hydnum rufescens UP504]